MIRSRCPRRSRRSEPRRKHDPPAFTLLSLLSLLLFAATVGVWVWTEVQPNESHSILSVGEVTIFGISGHIGYRGPPEVRRPQGLLMPYQPNAVHMTFIGATVLLVQCWKLAAGFAVLPLTWFVLRHHGRRGAAGVVCVKCAYNLTGNTSGVCPECGTPTEASAKLSNFGEPSRPAR